MNWLNVVTICFSETYRIVRLIAGDPARYVMYMSHVSTDHILREFN
jgi:hypothetical protein